MIPKPSQNWLELKNAPAKKTPSPVISISRRVVPLSVRRSRIKRLVRESVRLSPCVPLENRSLHFVVRGPVPDKLKLHDVQPIVDALIRGKLASTEER